jgi:GAF domain-containing protein
MQPLPEAAPAGLTAALRGVAADLKRVSGADMISVFLYDEPGRRYYAPYAIGQSEENLVEGLVDMSQQLNRYLDDAAQGKAPDQLSVPQYGSTVWLTINRRTLLAPDAGAEIASTFVHRYRVRSVLGLPLLAGDRLLGIAYLNYVDGKKASKWPDARKLAELEKQAEAAGLAIQAGLAASERAALEGLARLTSRLTRPPENEGALRRTLSIVLADLLWATNLDAAAVYQFADDRKNLNLVTAHAPAVAPATVQLGEGVGGWEAAVARTVGEAMGQAQLRPLDTLSLGGGSEALGYLVVLSRDPLARARRPPAGEILIRAGSELIGGVLESRRLIAELDHSGRLLGALAGMTNAMIQPGATRQEVIGAVAAHLTDAQVPEFDFHFATVYLLAARSLREVAVWMAAGAATTERIDSTQVAEPGNGARRVRVPRWALDKERTLADDDVLVHVARGWQVVVVGAKPIEGAPAEELITGPVPESRTLVQVPAVRSDGETAAVVPACLIGEPNESAGVLSGADGRSPFTLAGDLFESSGHADLIRVFLPFGFDTEGLASGVLEVGYHRSSGRRPDWGQIEALRSAAAQVAVAVETARLYEEARQHAQQLELSADISRAIASSIDLDQTLRLVAGNLVRLVGASLCQIALYEEDGEGWYGAAASDQEDEWRRQRGERPEPSFLFEVMDKREPLQVEDVSTSELVSLAYAETFGVRSLLALPLVADGEPIGAAVLAQRDRVRIFTPEERQIVEGLAHQAAVAIKNARLHALAEEERHIQKDFILVGLGMWGYKAYQHLQTLKQFFNFRLHVVEQDFPGARERLAAREAEVLGNGDGFCWDSPAAPAVQQLARELEPSCYVITYIATPAATHLATLANYHPLSNVVLIEKPLGSPPEEYREFLDSAPPTAEIVAADHYYFKLEVRLLQSLLREERTLRDFLDSVTEISIEILEEQPLTGAAADIGVVADLVPHAFAIISLFTAIDRIQLDSDQPLQIGRHHGLQGSRESYAQLNGSFPHRGRSVRLRIDAGKGVENAKWIKLSGDRRLSGRSPFYKFDFGKGEAIDGTQSTVRAAVRTIREPGVPDNAHLTMLRQVIEKRHPAVGILSIREAIRANVRIRQLEALAGELLERGEVTTYELGTRPSFNYPGASRRSQQQAEPESAAIRP